MIRLLLAMLLALGAFVGGALRFARERDATRELDVPIARTIELEARQEPPAREVKLATPAPAKPERKPAPRRAPAPPPPTPPPPLVEEVIPPQGAFAEAPLSQLAADSGEGAPSEAAQAVVTAVDQDAWADLIRRMLALYARAGQAQ